MNVDAGEYATVAGDGFRISSNSESEEEIRANLDAAEKPLDAPAEKDEDEPDPLSKAAAELGKKGGKAAAKARKEAAKDEADETDEDEPEKEAAEAKRKASEEIEGAPKDQRKKLASDRVAEATRAAAEAKREAAQLRAEVERLRTERQAPPTQEQPKEPARPAQQALADDPQDPRPKEDDFEEYADFVEARARWAARREYAQREQQARRHQAMEGIGRGIQTAVQTFTSKLAETPEESRAFVSSLSEDVQNLVPSFNLAPGQRPGPLNVVMDEIIRSEHPRELMQHLSDSPDVLQRLATLRTPASVMREMARLDGRFGAATSGTPAPKAEASKAKPPVRPVTGSPQTADPYEVDDSISVEEHIRRMNARDSAERRASARR